MSDSKRSNKLKKIARHLLNKIKKRTRRLFGKGSKVGKFFKKVKKSFRTAGRRTRRFFILAGRVIAACFILLWQKITHTKFVRTVSPFFKRIYKVISKALGIFASDVRRKMQLRHKKAKRAPENTTFYGIVVAAAALICVFFKKIGKRLQSFYYNIKARIVGARADKSTVLKKKPEQSRPADQRDAALLLSEIPDDEDFELQGVENMPKANTEEKIVPAVPQRARSGIMAVKHNSRVRRSAPVNKTEDDDDKEKYSIWIRDRRPFFAVSIGVTVCKVFLLLIVLAGFAGLGVAFGVARAYIASAPELSVEKIESNDQTSFLYDVKGELMTEYYAMENRTWASYDEISTILKYAIVASEDETFFEHDGFNFKRIFASLISNLSGGSVSGGSTITQQVLKLTLLTSQQTYKRKIQEIYLAYQLEKEYDKEEILEWYMNIMPMGGLVYGVKAAADEYFGKELSELSIRECAVLAGMTNAPTYYNPRFCMMSTADGGYGEEGRLRLYERANYVITQMYTFDFITLEEYKESLFDVEDMVTDQLVVKMESSNYTYDHKYYIEYVIDEIIEKLMRANDWEGNMGEQQAYSLLRSGGFHIYTAFDEEIQSSVENSVYTHNWWPPFVDPSDSISAGGLQQPQGAAVVIDNRTGYIVAIVGGRYEPTVRMGLNRASQSALMLGSSIKPLSVYGPALEEGLLTNMIVEDIPAPIDGWQSETGFPRNSSSTYNGPLPISLGLIRSLNVPTARILLDRLTPQLSYNYLTAMNISAKHLSLSPSLLCLGSNGNYLDEYTGAFATLANSGIYREPISVTKIVDKDGGELFGEDDQIFKQIFKSSTVYILTEWLHRAVSPPDSSYYVTEITGRPGIECAAKTGTNEDNRGITFVGYTKYYTCGVWMGHDDVKSFVEWVSAAAVARTLWMGIMTPLHLELDDAVIYDERPDDVIEVTICAVSGKLPNGEICAHDQHGYGTTTEYFIRGTEPTEICDMHFEVAYCTDSGLLANEYCTPDCYEYKTAVRLDADSEYLKLYTEIKEDDEPSDEEDEDEDKDEALAKQNNELLFSYFPIFFVDGVPYTADGVGEPCYCTVHDADTFDALQIREQMIQKANALIDSINKKLKISDYSDNVTLAQKKQIQVAIELLELRVSAPVYSPSDDVEEFDLLSCNEAYNALQSLTDEIFGAIDERIELKKEYTKLGTALIVEINNKIMGDKYSAVITTDETRQINRATIALSNAFNAPLYSSNPENAFDADKVKTLYEDLQKSSEELFALLDSRLDYQPPIGGDKTIISVFKDDNTATLLDELNSQYAVLIDSVTGKIIASKNSDVKMYPASMTKVMFAIVAYEYMLDKGIDINTQALYITEDVLNYCEIMDAATAGFVAGEIVKIKDLFYGVLMQSGADAVITLANSCMGSEAAFADLMNAKAKELGLKNTHFVNCTGLHDPDHYSTAEDMAVIIAYADNYQFLRDIMSTRYYAYPATNKQEARAVANGLTAARTEFNADPEASVVPGTDVFGGKTGYTEEALYCLATFAHGQGGKYIVVTGSAESRNKYIEDYMYLYGYYSELDPDRPLIPTPEIPDVDENGGETGGETGGESGETGEDNSENNGEVTE